MVTCQPLTAIWADYYHPHATGGTESLGNEQMFPSSPAEYVAGPGFELMSSSITGGPEVKVRLHWGTR